MNFEEALALAEKYFREKNGTKVARALDAQTHWIFYGGERDQVDYGGAGIKIDRQTGAIGDFILPDSSNFELLDRAEPIAL